MPSLLSNGVTSAAIVAAILSTTPADAKFLATFSVTSTDPCFKTAPMAPPFGRRPITRTYEGITQTNDMTPDGFARNNFTIAVEGPLVDAPFIYTYALSQCEGQPVEVDRLSFGIQVIAQPGPGVPLSIERSLCVGPEVVASDDGCCAFNLCNGFYFESGGCPIICDGKRYELAWDPIEWDGQ